MTGRARASSRRGHQAPYEHAPVPHMGGLGAVRTRVVYLHLTTRATPRSHARPVRPPASCKPLTRRVEQLITTSQLASLDAGSFYANALHLTFNPGRRPSIPGLWDAEQANYTTNTHQAPRSDCQQVISVCLSALSVFCACQCRAMTSRPKAHHETGPLSSKHLAPSGRARP